MRVSANLSPDEVKENLSDAGCHGHLCECIVNSIFENDAAEAQKLIEECRQNYLDIIHEKQKCIDRLDYLSWRIRQQ